MRVFAISDIHIDYEENRKWLNRLSSWDYTKDVLVLAGDVTDNPHLLDKAFEHLKSRFSEVLYVPGNHDLWVYRDPQNPDSLRKFYRIKELAGNCGIRMEPFHSGELSIVPLLGWYDYSFGRPSGELLDAWADYGACRWPQGMDEAGLTRYFTSLNEAYLDTRNRHVISFSHFLPRIDIMPVYIPQSRRMLYPVLGSSMLEKQVRALNSSIHVYGHSHVNVHVTRDNTAYINNAFGYPYEIMITAKRLKCVYETK